MLESFSWLPECEMAELARMQHESRKNSNRRSMVAGLLLDSGGVNEAYDENGKNGRKAEAM